MPFSLSEIVPWGRSFDEYVGMFDLRDGDLRRSILGCADGPAAFNAELTKRRGKIVSCDPLYALSVREIERRIEQSFATVLEQTRRNFDGFVWSDRVPGVETLGRVRMAAMRTFLDDLEPGTIQGRYVAAQLPNLPFADQAFDLALCSHFLFLYGSLGLEFHLLSLLELARVAREIRVFPLLQLDRQRSPFLPQVMEELTAHGQVVEIVAVPYEFQRGANQMLRIARPSGDPPKLDQNGSRQPSPPGGSASPKADLSFGGPHEEANP